MGRMNCRSVRRRIADGRPVAPGQEEHLLACAGCRATAAAAERLARAGAAERDRDLPPAAREATLREARAILMATRASAPRARGADAAGWWRRAAAVALPAAAVLVAALMLLNRAGQHRQEAAAAAALNLEREIEAARADLQESLARFQRLYATPPHRDRFVTVSRRLKDGVASYARDVQRELRPDGAGGKGEL